MRSPISQNPVYGSLGSSRCGFHGPPRDLWKARGEGPVPHPRSPPLPSPHLFEIPVTSLQGFLAVHKRVARFPPQLHEELLAGSRGQPGPRVKCMPRLGRLKQRAPGLGGGRRDEAQEAARSPGGGSAPAGGRLQERRAQRARGKAAPGRGAAKRHPGGEKGEVEPAAARGGEGSVPGARETCEEGRKRAGPGALSWRLPGRTTRQRRNDRSSDIFPAAGRRGGGARSAPTGPRPTARRRGQNSPRNAPSGDSAPCRPGRALAAPPTWAC